MRHPTDRSGGGSRRDGGGVALQVRFALGQPHFLDDLAGVGYVFTRDTTGAWSEVRELKGSPIYQGRWMGISASIDQGIIALGTADDSGSAAVWLFRRRPSGNWPANQDERLFDETGSISFGRPAEISEGTVVVGSNRDLQSGFGAVYSFDLDSLGSNYCCPAAANSTREWGRIRASGSTDAAADDLWLGAGYLPSGNVGFFLASDGNGIVQPPGSDGPMCLGGGSGLRRILPPILTTDQDDGGFSLSIGTQSVPGLGAIVPGRTWNFQAWYRDNVVGTSNLTDAVSVAFE